MNRVLVIAPHIDDAEAGCGGLIHRLSREGKQVTILSLCKFTHTDQGMEVVRATNILQQRETGSKIERIDANVADDLTFSQNELAVRAHIRRAFRDSKPDWLVYPASDDYHEDHGVVRRAALVYVGEGLNGLAFRPLNRGGLPRPTMFVSLKEEDVTAKFEALNQYKIARGRRWASLEAIEGAAIAYGLPVRKPYAEAYVLEREVI